uniref:Uncharacterized protein n=1 Tax=Fagus sylvatica TaxID=28930 RepID=A0A2N9I9B7_FAGSY
MGLLLVKGFEGTGREERETRRWKLAREKRSLRWVSVFGVSVMEVSRERKKKSDTKEEGGGGCLEKRSPRWVWVFGVSVMEVSRERLSWAVGETCGKDREKIKGPAAQRRRGDG